MNKTVLVLVDLNETFIHRSTVETTSATLVLGEGKMKRWISVRPGTDDFLNQLLDNKDVQVGFYTSMMTHNAQPIVAHLLTKDTKAVQVFDRDFNKKDPTAKNDWDTMRDPDAVWAFLLKETGLHFDASNTLFIDNDLRKIRDYATSAIIVPSWDGSTTTTSFLGTLSKTIKDRLQQFATMGDVRTSSERISDVEQLAKHIEAILSLTKSNPQSLLRVIGALASHS